MTSLQDNVAQLFAQQLESWDLARKNYEALSGVEVRSFDFEGFQVMVQFNPARMVSSGAKVDAKTIAARKCFLCAENRPEVQRGIEWRNYEVLINPFPIFRRHLTIPLRNHKPQSLLEHFGDMLDLARELTDYVVFYNGPCCGASAPDHMHFQAGNSDFLPLVSDYFNLKNIENRVVRVDTTGRAKTYVIMDYLRCVYCVESPTADAAQIAFMKLYNEWISEPFVEPMMNVVVLYRNDMWYVFAIPRGAFRPWQYSEEGDKQLLISPATVEMSGLFITPRREHFDAITREDIIDIFSQTSYK